MLFEKAMKHLRAGRAVYQLKHADADAQDKYIVLRDGAFFCVLRNGLACEAQLETADILADDWRLANDVAFPA